MGRDKYYLAIMGATGAVGNCMLKILEERNFPVGNLKLLASERSVGKKLSFKGKEYTVEELKENSFKGVELVLSSAGASRSKQFVPHAVKAGAVVIDNTSFFRMDPVVPLVVPEVNPQDIKKHKGIIANPNCSTIQMVVALAPIHRKVGIKRIVVSTYQSVSGAGQAHINELCSQTKQWVNGEKVEVAQFPFQIAFNLIPQIDVFLDNGYTKEEMKMVNETRKIFGDTSIQVNATCVRVPVFYAHSESVTVETKEKISPQEVRELLSIAPGVVIIDDPSKQKYPMPFDAGGTDPVYVGRIRDDVSSSSGISMWIVADNLRKGAALNAVQIAEELIK
ncbi:MAG: aspartate-semialdehyde dehydrogenase [Candidatus Omnitrophica bacterium]|nr:aspartate-semialdehyde dehydrogenase [Candidatus Omnitrophota bacterium]